MFNDQEHKKQREIRIFGSMLVALSGSLLFADKIMEVIGLEGSNTYGFSTFSNFMWVFMQSVAPILMIIGFLLKPYLLSILIPIHCYTIQIIWVFRPRYHYDNVYLQLYAFGTCVLFIFLFLFIKWVGKITRKKAVSYTHLTLPTIA